MCVNNSGGKAGLYGKCAFDSVGNSSKAAELVRIPAAVSARALPPHSALPSAGRPQACGPFHLCHSTPRVMTSHFNLISLMTNDVVHLFKICLLSFLIKCRFISFAHLKTGAVFFFVSANHVLRILDTSPLSVAHSLVFASSLWLILSGSSQRLLRSRSFYILMKVHLSTPFCYDFGCLCPV